MVAGRRRGLTFLLLFIYFLVFTFLRGLRQEIQNEGGGGGGSEDSGQEMQIHLGVGDEIVTKSHSLSNASDKSIDIKVGCIWAHADNGF